MAFVRVKADTGKQYSINHFLFHHWRKRLTRLEVEVAMFAFVSKEGSCLCFDDDDRLWGYFSSIFS